MLYKVYEFVKTFKVESTKDIIELKGKRVSIKDEGMSTYYCLQVEGLGVFLGSKTKVENYIRKGWITLSDNQEVIPLNISSQCSRLPITHDNLISNGYKKIANMYYNGEVTVILIKGHTWHLSDIKNKYGRDVKFIDEIL